MAEPPAPNDPHDLAAADGPNDHGTHAQRWDRSHRMSVLVAGVVGLALVAAMITRTSQAAFTANTNNAGNYFNAGTVTIGDNDSDAALFELDAMDPGETYTSCINVQYTGSITAPGAVKVYAGTPAPTESDSLGDHITLTIERGTSTSSTFGDCGTFTSEATDYNAVVLSSFYTNNTNYTNGAGTWTPTGTPETRTYRITAELLDSVPDSQEGATISGVTLVWEIVS